jgi:hypothetical protein
VVFFVLMCLRIVVKYIKNFLLSCSNECAIGF